MGYFDEMQERVRRAEEKKAADLARLRESLARAMRKAGCDPEGIHVEPGTYQDAYADITGVAITGDDPACTERAARWTHTYLVQQGQKTATFSFWGGRSAHELSEPAEDYIGPRVLRDRARAHTWWIRTGWYSIGD